MIDIKSRSYILHVQSVTYPLFFCALWKWNSLPASLFPQNLKITTLESKFQVSLITRANGNFLSYVSCIFCLHSNVTVGELSPNCYQSSAFVFKTRAHRLRTRRYNVWNCKDRAHRSTFALSICHLAFKLCVKTITIN